MKSFVITEFWKLTTGTSWQYSTQSLWNKVARPHQVSKNLKNIKNYQNVT